VFGDTLTQLFAAEGVADILNFTQHPLARVNESYAFCHHGGWYECSMQTHALCAKMLKPADLFAMFDFVECNFGNLGTNDADNVRLCASNASIAYSKMWECATGYGARSGPGMLLESANFADSLGVNMAPTVILNGVQIPGVPTFPELLKAVCDAYTGTKPPGCTAPASDVPTTKVERCRV